VLHSSWGGESRLSQTCTAQYTPCKALALPEVLRLPELPLQYGFAAVGPLPRCAPNQWSAMSGVRWKTHQSITRPSFAFLPCQWFCSCSCKERPDRRGLIRCITHRRWLLRSSYCCGPRDTPCGDVCPRASAGGAGSFSMFPIDHDDDLGSPYTPAVLLFASAH